MIAVRFDNCRVASTQPANHHFNFPTVHRLIVHFHFPSVSSQPLSILKTSLIDTNPSRCIPTSYDGA